MSGFGLSPFGTSMFGYGDIASTDPRSTKTIVARTLDPETRDYVIDGRGLEETTSVLQRVIIALTSTKGSGAAVPNLGLEITPGQLMGSGFEAKITDDVKRSLFQLSDVEKKIKILEVIVSKIGFVANVTVGFIDLTDPENKPQYVKLPVRT